MDSPGRNKDTPLKAKSASEPPRASPPHLKAKRDTQLSVKNRSLSDGKIPSLLNRGSSTLHADEEVYTTKSWAPNEAQTTKDPHYLPRPTLVDTKTAEHEESDSRVTPKRDRSWDVPDFDSPAISGALHSDGVDEPPRKRVRLIEPAVPEALVTTMGRGGHSDHPGDSATYSNDDRPQSTSISRLLIADLAKRERRLGTLRLPIAKLDQRIVKRNERYKLDLINTGASYPGQAKKERRLGMLRLPIAKLNQRLVKRNKRYKLDLMNTGAPYPRQAKKERRLGILRFPIAKLNQRIVKRKKSRGKNENVSKQAE